MTPVRQGPWGRQLPHYPATGARRAFLGLTVVLTVALYYLAFVNSGVATLQASEFGLSFKFITLLAMAGGAAAALTAVGAGLADRLGRANIAVYGLLLCGLLIAFGVPATHSKWPFAVATIALALLEGAVLVVTPALIRDFSPQVGRGSAMGFWTLGPVLGSLIVSQVASHTLTGHPDWRFQYHLAGGISLAVGVVVFFTLRELSPQLRDQVVVSERDKQLVEAKARGIDPERALQGHWRQMLRLRIVGPAVGFNLFLGFYYLAVALLVPFFITTFSYEAARANSLANWFWSSMAIALVVSGLLSDRLGVRKPFMVGGGILSLIGTGMFAVATDSTTTSYSHWRLLIVVVAAGTGITFAAWLAAFTETVEEVNPAATATGLAVWGSTLRLVTVALSIGALVLLPALKTLYDTGSRVAQLASGADPRLSSAQNALVKDVAADPTIATKAQTLAATYTAQLGTAAKLSPATQAALSSDPTSPATQAQAVSEISGVPVGEVAQLGKASATYADQIKTAAAVQPATLAALTANPTDPATQAAAVGQIAAGLAVSPAVAVTRLQALATVPPADLALLGKDGPAVQQAAAQLGALASVPPADLQFLGHYAGLRDPAVLANLTYLQQHAGEVLAAQKDSRGQWSRFWWIAFAAQFALFPFIPLMAGRWTPGKARRDVREHEALIERELASLGTPA